MISRWYLQVGRAWSTSKSRAEQEGEQEGEQEEGKAGAVDTRVSTGSLTLCAWACLPHASMSADGRSCTGGSGMVWPGVRTTPCVPPKGSPKALCLRAHNAAGRQRAVHGLEEGLQGNGGEQATCAASRMWPAAVQHRDAHSAAAVSSMPAMQRSIAGPPAKPKASHHLGLL